MTDVAIACNPFGVKLDELPVSIAREYEITYNVKAAHGSFTIPARDPKATARNLRYGNIVYVKSNQAGIPAWAGVIWPCEPSGSEIKNGELTIQMRSTEWLLAKRPTAAKDIITGSPGAIFLKLITAALRYGYMPISTATSGVDLSGGSITNEYNFMDCYSAINQLAEDNDAYWGFSPVITSTNTLSLKPYWVYKRSKTFRGVLNAGGSSPNLAISSIFEAGEIATRILAYARAESWDAPIFYEIDSPASLGRYKTVYVDVVPCLDQTTLQDIIPIAVKERKKRQFPSLQIDGVILQPPFPAIGDVCSVLMPETGSFITESRKAIVTTQMTKAVYAPLDETLTVHLEEIL